MAIVYIDGKYTAESTNGATLSAAMASAAAANDLVVCCANGQDPISSVSGGGVAWNLAKTNDKSAIYYGIADGSGGTTITVTFSAKSGNRRATIARFSGTATTSLLDVTGSASASSTNPASGSLTTNAANAVVVGMAGLGTGSSTYSSGPTNSFTEIDAAGNPRTKFFSAYRIVSATGTYSTDWTITSSLSWDGCIAAFKAPASLAIVLPVNRPQFYSTRRR